MSSAFLYVGIVAIWAFVLVPRWLRRPQALPEPAAEYEANSDGDAGYDDRQDYERDGYDQPTGGRGSGDAAAAAESGSASLRAAAARRAVPPLTRSRVLQARRRLLTLLMLLCAAAAVCTALKLTLWWACVPPAGMLGMYLLLLREAALADAELAGRRAALELRVRAARQRAQDGWEASADEHSAEIIDISARIGDQLYDQYADATIRAVGD